MATAGVEPGYACAVSNPEDKRARMAKGLARLNRESAARTAAAGPAKSIAQALELSELVRRSDSNFEKPLPPSLPALWKALHRGPK